MERQGGLLSSAAMRDLLTSQPPALPCCQKEKRRLSGMVTGAQRQHGQQEWAGRRAVKFPDPQGT